MVRRKQFRTILDADVTKLRAWLKVEQEKRQDFSKNIHTYLPSQFCPQLRDNVPELTLDGSASEYSFADVKDAVINIEIIKSAFANDKTYEAVRNPQSARPSNGDAQSDINIASA